MLIALDYDGTYTADPELWKQFIHTAFALNHEIICVTMRYEHELDSMDMFLKSRVRVICTNRLAKKEFLHKMDIHPDIWIDDNPDWLYEDALPSSRVME